MCLFLLCRRWRRKPSIFIHSCETETPNRRGPTRRGRSESGPSHYKHSPALLALGEAGWRLSMVLTTQEPGQIHPTQPNRRRPHRHNHEVLLHSPSDQVTHSRAQQAAQQTSTSRRGRALRLSHCAASVWFQASTGG